MLQKYTFKMAFRISIKLQGVPVSVKSDILQETAYMLNFRVLDSRPCHPVGSVPAFWVTEMRSKRLSHFPIGDQGMKWEGNSDPIFNQIEVPKTKFFIFQLQVLRQNFMVVLYRACVFGIIEMDRSANC